ncbi:MAG: ABC transporter ATP-binding protein [Planctomycetes bacterium]|nr:ABC transporter ATP-binding protein [Planctomycetota bacterium]
MRWPLASALLFTTLLTLLGLIPPLLLKEVIDRVITRGRWDVLPAILAVALGVAVCTAGMALLNRLVITYVGQKFVFHLRNHLYKSILKHSLRFFDERGAGQVMSRLMEDTASVQRMISANSVTLVNDAVAVLFCSVTILWLRWELGLVVLALVPLYILNHLFFVRRIQKKTREMLDYREKVVGEMEERISGTRLVKAYSREEAESERMWERMEEIIRLASEGTRLNSAFTGAATTITSIGNACLYCLGCYFVLTEWMSYGQVMAFMAYVTRLFQSALQFTQVTGDLQETMVSVDRVLEILDQPVEIVSRPGAIELPRMQGRVSFENVTFGYVPDRPVLRNFTLDVPAGKTVALVGPSGCGKTTVTALLQRFYEPQRGCIRMDGHDISQVQIRALRSKIGQVLQQPFLFDGTIRENILYGSRVKNDARMVEAAQVANIHDWIVSLPEAYHTVLGEDGLRPSLGQKQQLSIARAVLIDPAILVLDEATSSLDSESEVSIQKALENVLRGRTAFVVAHRLSTIRKADIIVVLERGQVVEKGAHEDLMKLKDGVYRAFYLKQSQSVVGIQDEVESEEGREEAARPEPRPPVPAGLSRGVVAKGLTEDAQRPAQGESVSKEERHPG